MLIPLLPIKKNIVFWRNRTTVILESLSASNLTGLSRSFSCHFYKHESKTSWIVVLFVYDII
jgi:hypothetical protein